MERRTYWVEIQGPLFRDRFLSGSVEATSARSAASLRTGYDDDDLSVAQGTVETRDAVEFKSRFTPRITVTLVEE